jgi:uncharacterized cupin superfamily protein
VSEAGEPRAPLNVLDVVPEGDADDPPGYRARMARFGPSIGAVQLGASVYELDTGQSVCPYHYEYGIEEWLLVLAGTPTLRDPDGDHVLEPGDLVCFPEGPEGAHKLTNHADATARILMLSTMQETNAAVYPDSGKVGVWPLKKLFRLSDAVDYWDGEL